MGAKTQKLYPAGPIKLIEHVRYDDLGYPGPGRSGRCSGTAMVNNGRTAGQQVGMDDISCKAAVVGDYTGMRFVPQVNQRTAVIGSGCPSKHVKQAPGVFPGHAAKPYKDWWRTGR